MLFLVIKENVGAQCLQYRSLGTCTHEMCAALAAKSDVKLFVLTDISGRYTDEEMIAEATRTFPNSRIAADFDRIVV